MTSLTREGANLPPENTPHPPFQYAKILRKGWFPTTFFSDATSSKQLKRRNSFRFDGKHVSDHSSSGQSTIYRELRDGRREDIRLGIDFNFSNFTKEKNSSCGASNPSLGNDSNSQHFLMLSLFK